jgi:hypothetical protein
VRGADCGLLSGSLQKTSLRRPAIVAPGKVALHEFKHQSGKVRLNMF